MRARRPTFARGAAVAALGMLLAFGTGASGWAGPERPATNVNTRQPDGSTPLLWAVYQGDHGRVSDLIAAGADVSIANNFGATPMSEAARLGDTESLRLLLKAGADPDSPNAEGQTALHSVARTGKVEAAALLLKHGANLEAREKWGGQTPLHWAATQNQVAMVRFLVSRGADVDARATVRDWQRRVTAEGRPKDMNRGGFTPLLYAAREGHIDVARELIRGKADINLEDPDATTPLVLALINGHWDFAKALIEAGADVNAWDFWGQSPLYVAVDMNILPAGFRVELPGMDATSGIDVIRLLLAKGANPNLQLKLRPPFRNVPQDRNADPALIGGATSLTRAASGGDLEAAKLLLDAGAIVDMPNEEGVTPLMAAVSAAGTRGKNKTEEQALAMVKLLADAGADVNTGGDSGITALHSAAFRGWDTLVKELVARGAKLDALESDNLTPVDYAMGRSRVGFLQTKPPVRNETANLLRQLGAKVEHPDLPPWPGVGTPGIRAVVPR